MTNPKNHWRLFCNLFLVAAVGLVIFKVPDAFAYLVVAYVVSFALGLALLLVENDEPNY